jgi:hypothetical protein
VETTDADHVASVEAYLLGRRLEELVPSAVFVVDRPGGDLSTLPELSNGYSELASDALLENELSHAAHRAVGFDEVERTVHFRKSL